MNDKNMTLNNLDLLEQVITTYYTLYEAIRARINRRTEVLKTHNEALIYNEFSNEHLFKSINKLANMSSALLPLKQSWSGVQFAEIWQGKEQASYIGSDVHTRNQLLQAIKFQVIANFHNKLESMLNDNDYKILRCVIFCYYVLFQQNINNECTLDYMSEDNKIIHHYSPINPDMMRSICIELITTLKNGDYEVRDDIGRIRKLQITHSHRTRRISKDELVDLIKRYVKVYNEQPTIRQLKDYYE